MFERYIEHTNIGIRGLDYIFLSCRSVTASSGRRNSYVFSCFDFYDNQRFVTIGYNIQFHFSTPPIYVSDNVSLEIKYSAARSSPVFPIGCVAP